MSLPFPERIAVHRDEATSRPEPLRGRPPDVIVGHGDALAHVRPDLAHVPDHLLLGAPDGPSTRSGPRCRRSGHHDVVVLVGERIAFGDLPPRFSLGPWLAREPDPEHDLEVEPLAPDSPRARPRRAGSRVDAPAARQGPSPGCGGPCNLRARRDAHRYPGSAPAGNRSTRLRGPAILCQGRTVSDGSCLRRAQASGGWHASSTSAHGSAKTGVERSHVGSLPSPPFTGPRTRSRRRIQPSFPPPAPSSSVSRSALSSLIS